MKTKRKFRHISRNRIGLGLGLLEEEFVDLRLRLVGEFGAEDVCHACEVVSLRGMAGPLGKERMEEDWR